MQRADLPGLHNGWGLLTALALALAVTVSGNRAQCLVGWVVGMGWTFGALLPTFIGTVIVALSGWMHRLLLLLLQRAASA